MTTQTDSTTEILDSLDFVPEIPCETRGHHDLPAHPSHFYMIWSCGHMLAVCKEWERDLKRHIGMGGLVYCSVCGQEDVTLIRVVPIGG